MTKELKTSDEWLKYHCLTAGEVVVLDPDGWDRTNFDYSWGEEKITYKEFQQRLCSSTIKYKFRKF